MLRVLVLIIVTMTASPVSAQVDTAAASAVEQPATDPAYDQMFDAMESGVDQEATLLGQVKATVAALIKSDAKFQELAAASPTFERRFVQVMLPFVRRHGENQRPVQRQQVTAMFERYLTPAEARTWATFYASPLGRKTVNAAQRNASYSAVASEAASSGEVTAAAVQRDLKRTEFATVRALQGNLTLEDQRQILLLMRKPSYPKLLAVMRELPQVRANAEMAPMDPALEAEAQVAVTEFLLKERGISLDSVPGSED